MEYFDLASMSPAGSINSNVNDMAKWLMLWIGGGKYRGKEILPPQFTKEAISSQMIVSGALPEKKTPDIYLRNYGFGWFISSYRGHYKVEHSGHIDGFSAMTTFYPTDSIGVVVFCNLDYSSMPEVVRDLLSDRVLRLKYKDWESEAYNDYLAGMAKAKETRKAVANYRKTGTQASHPLDDYTGTYTPALSESFELQLKNDTLFMQLPKESLWLQHIHYDVFEPVNDNPIFEYFGNTKIIFRMNDSGNIASASVAFPLMKPVLFTKLPKALAEDSLER